MRIIATETQSLEQQPHLTGVPRVASHLNSQLIAPLRSRGFSLARMHTWPDQPRAASTQADFLRSAEILRQPIVSPEEAEVCIFLDVSHVNFPRLAQPELRSTPKVFLIHDILPIQHPEWFPEGASRGYRLFLRQVLAVADHVVVYSRHGAKELSRLGWPTTAQMHVIPLGSHIPAAGRSPSRGPERSPDADYSLLYVSTIEPRKGHDLLLDTFDLLLRGGHDLRLTLVGRQGWDVARNWEVGDLVRRIRGHPEYGSRLHWHEKASDSDVAALATTATHGVIPAIDEGFGLFLEEALGLGLAVVASDIPVFAERPHPRVRLASRTPEAFADAILASRVTIEPHHSVTPVRTMADAATDWAELLGTLA